MPGVGSAQLETETSGAPSERVIAGVPRRAWLTSGIALWIVVVAFGVVTLLWSAHVGVGLRDPSGRLFRHKLLNAILAFLGLAVVDVLVRTLRTDRSVAGLRRQFRGRWDPRRLGLLLAGLVGYHVVYVCYRNMKSWDAFNTPRDQDLLAFDRHIFGGHSPASLIHDLLGQSATMASFLGHVYESFPALVSLAVVAAPAFITATRRGLVTPAAAMWAWILGTISYYAVPSLGPCYSAAADFAGLPHTSITDTQASYLSERAAFLAHPSDPSTFVSISAFASLHVGLTCLITLLAAYYRKRILTLVLAVYLVLVAISTIYFGWHFFADVLAGVVLAALSLALGHLTVYPRTPLSLRRRRQAEVTATA